MSEYRDEVPELTGTWPVNDVSVLVLSPSTFSRVYANIICW